MKKNVDLTSGSIFSSLLKLSIPILGTSFIQMAYNMIDMIWIGRLGSPAVAAVGTAGFFAWFGGSLALIAKIGTEVGVAQAIGKEELKEKNRFIYNGLFITVIISIMYTILVLLLRNQLIGFFNLGDLEIINMSIEYLVIIALGMIFLFLNPIFTGIFNACGDSKTPFIINTVGLVINIILDPILIFGYLGFPKLGVAGAGIATVFAQAMVSLIFILIFISSGYSFRRRNMKYINKGCMNTICKLGMPAALQNALFSFFSMVIGRVVADFGAVSIAVQKVGSQIEAISWMTAGGFSTALTSFIGQNYGANKWDRIFKGYKATMIMATVLGIIATLLLVFAGEQIFALFIPEAEAIAQGKIYLMIIGACQLFMCLEITAAGAFSGLGNTVTPSWVSIVFTGLRVPLCMLLSAIPALGINGVWWGISITAIIKGILLTALFFIMVTVPYRKKRQENIDNLEANAYNNINKTIMIDSFDEGE